MNQRSSPLAKYCLMKTKHINLADIDHEVDADDFYYQFSSIPDGYCPHDQIQKFWDKYSLIDSQIFAYELQVLAEYDRGGVTGSTISRESFTDFRMDVARLLMAVYYEHTYNGGKERIVFRG